MDLIYMTDKKIDVGVMDNYEFDLAFGSDENDFTCKIALEDHCCKAGYMLYIEGKEYGGIIDKISPDTKAKTVTYGGRTWHGVLESKIISPDDGEDYLYLSGEANEVLGFLIRRVGLSNLFSVSKADSGIEIVNYPVYYGSAYTTIKTMLYEFDGKLNITFSKGYVVLSAVPFIDYSRDEEWDSSQFELKITKNYSAVNHLICLGKGNLKDRHIIHLFTDENGGLQPYATTDNPRRNTDYILDMSKKVMHGEDEITGIYDSANTQDTTNYLILESEPPDWQNTFSNYYRQKSNSTYEALKSEIKDEYTQQLSQPQDWLDNYKTYYTHSGDKYTAVSSESQTNYNLQAECPPDWNEKYNNYFTCTDDKYNPVRDKVTDTYVLQSSRPSDWEKNYNIYYSCYNDGTQRIYRRVNGDLKNKYNVQTMQPSDWDKNYKSYYLRDNDGKGYSKISAPTTPKWSERLYYTLENYQAAPNWNSEPFYTCIKTTSPPSWQPNTYYTKSVNSVPTWSTNTYYTKTKKTIIPEFAAEAYFEKVIDNYAVLVAGGIKKLKKSYDCDKIAISLDPRQVYDINDVVGANENITGIMVWQPITKKIVKINECHETIEYKIGD